MTVSLVAAAPRALTPRGWSSLAVVTPESMTDEDLLELVAKDRDQAAFEVLYQRYSRAIYSLVLRILRDRHRGEDVAQEAFAAVWRAAKGYHRGRGSAAGWMFAIAAMSMGASAVLSKSSARAEQLRRSGGEGETFALEKRVRTILPVPLHQLRLVVE